MTVGDEPRRPHQAGTAALAVLKRIAVSPRLYVYVASALAVVLTSYFLGKEMIWDTMDYHVYAGFSALHDRFARDYFAAGPQGYFNPYAYVPFYLLIRSSLTPLEDASILAVLQSAILWLTYELTLAVAPEDKPKARVVMGVLAAVFAFANPVLINQFGSSYIDITTAEVALAGWLVLVGAVRSPSVLRVIGAALLLGAASALKPTNAVHAVAATTLVLFIPGSWWRKIRDTSVFAVCGTVGFVLVNLPWSAHLERHFGNPVFPLLNGVFRSPYYSTASLLDYRFIPASLSAALLRPFAIMLPIPMVQYELVAPDLRYALLLVLAATALVLWGRRRLRNRPMPDRSAPQAPPSRAFVALCCGFLVDWVLWLTASGNGRYFIPMACVAGVLCLVLVFRLFSSRPKVRNYALAAIVLAQLIQVYLGSGYRTYLPWTKGPWFSVSVPAVLATRPNLYVMLGGQTNSFIIPDMPRGSAFVNLGGSYMFIRPNGPNGRRVKTLIRRYAPHVRVVVQDLLSDARRTNRLENRSAVENTLAPFGLHANTHRCAKILVHGVMIPYRIASGIQKNSDNARRESHTEYLLACRVTEVPADRIPKPPGRRAADLAFDHLEDACPALFEPRRPGDRILGDRRYGYYFERKYPDTGVVAWITHGTVRFEKLINGHEEDAGSERMWQNGVPRVVCGRGGAGFLRVLRKRP